MDTQKELLILLCSKFKTNKYSLEQIAELFPNNLGKYFTLFTIPVPSIATNSMEVIPLCTSWGKLKEFTINMGTIIYKEHFDYLDNIVLEYLKNYKMPTNMYQLHLQFPEEATTHFINVCNSFKGEKWDNVIDTFLNEIYDYFIQGKILDNSIIKY